MVWCGLVWCGVVWCDVVWRGVVWCGVVWCRTLGANHRASQAVAAFDGSLEVSGTRSEDSWRLGCLLSEQQGQCVWFNS